MSKENTNQPKYMWIYNHYKTLITSGVLKIQDKLPTENEIGELFNVSRITVTKALNMLTTEGFIYRTPGDGTYVKENDPLANDNKVNLISLIVSFQPQGREIELIHGIETHLKEKNYLLSVNNSDDNPDIEKQLINNIKNKAKGIILYPSSSSHNTDIFYNMFQDQYPIIFVDKFPFSVPCSYVVSDNYDGGYQIGKYLTEKGHRKIALIFHDVTEFTSEKDRLNGFMKAIGEKNISRDNIKIISIQRNERVESINSIFHELLKEKNDHDRITAIFSCNDVVAYDLMNFAEAGSYKLPPNFILAGFDDINIRPHTLPFITMRQELYDIGETAAKLILKKIESNSFFNEQHIVPVELVEKF